MGIRFTEKEIIVVSGDAEIEVVLTDDEFLRLKDVCLENERRLGVRLTIKTNGKGKVHKDCAITLNSWQIDY